MSDGKSEVDDLLGGFAKKPMVGPSELEDSLIGAPQKCSSGS